MPKAASEKQYNNFIKGLITEASALTFPENASLDEDNFILERTGKRSRRFGVDFEAGYTLNPSGIVEGLIATSRQSFHRWESPSGDTSIHIGVIRVYNKLWFIDLLSDSPSTNLLNSGNPVIITGLENSLIDTAVINNNFILVSKDIINPILLTYNTTTDVISQEAIEITIRDLFGVDDGLTVLERPATLSNSHKYNLRNQGWSSRITSTCGTDAIDCTFTTIAGYPSNADVWTLGKIEDVASASFEKYDPASMKKNSFDNAPAAKGFYVIDAFSRGPSRETESGITTLAIDTEENNLSTIASFAGRVFYSGIASSVTGSDSLSPTYSGFIFFSQVTAHIENIGKCYQEADPTSNTISDIIDTDGGTIQIPDITKINKLIATKSSLLIFAQNGVWEIFGDTGGFTATSFQISKISSIGTASPRSIVEINGTVLYWSKAGIFMLTQDEISGRYQAQNITIGSIQTFYNDIPVLAVDNAVGFFDEPQNRVRWLYNDNADYGLTNYINKYNRELILDLTLEAFYPHKIESLASSSPYICDYIEVPRYISTADSNVVYVDNDIVLATADTIVIPSVTSTSRRSQFSFLTFRGTDFTVSKYGDTSFVDWFTSDGVGINYSSYLITGYEIFGDVMRKKQTPYLVMLFDRTEDGFTLDGSNLVLDNQSSCLVQAQWNWTNSDGSGKWGTQFQAYRFKRNYTPTGENDSFDYGEIVIVTKNKLRGSGKALSLYIQSEAGKDMRLLGWGVLLEGGSSV